MGDLTGKNAIITGAASGIGYAGVEVFVEAGANVVAGDIQDEKGKALETRFGSDRVRYVHCDVTKTADLQQLFDTAEHAFGGLDILWNNAGHGGTPTGVEDLDEDGWDATMGLLLKSVFVGTKLAIPYMKKRGGGSVVNT
ncbi:MAG: SDR family oxidoreductase, partial [Henriciella sp.]|uniref:SDR family NAD(P)-dependent oxidoreductase n=1 Tax=Henriciella sp. TaxID=1968823 RepID=UPI003C758A03